MDAYMRTAYDEALSGLSKKHGGPFGAVIVKDSEIVSQAHNEVLLRNDPTAHAETVAIRRACEKLKTTSLRGCALYTTAKPCPMCKGAIQWSGITKVFFSGDYSDTEKLNFNDRLFSDNFDNEEDWLQIDNENFTEIIDAFDEYREEIKY